MRLTGTKMVLQGFRPEPQKKWKHGHTWRLPVEGAHLDSAFVPTYRVDVKIFLRISENFSLRATLEEISGDRQSYMDACAKFHGTCAIAVETESQKCGPCSGAKEKIRESPGGFDPQWTNNVCTNSPVVT